MTTQRAALQRKRIAGFSISELLTVLALMGLLILFGGPAMADAFRSYKVRSAADILATDVRALRYAAVAGRTSLTMTLNDQDDSTAPNQYTFTNFKGDTVTRRLESGVSIETSSAAAITFSAMGSTGQSSSQTLVVSMPVNDTRGDRYTISVTPSGTVSAAYSTYTP
jgi:Tfp pilus assembly protein FimT